MRIKYSCFYMLVRNAVGIVEMKALKRATVNAEYVLNVEVHVNPVNGHQTSKEIVYTEKCHLQPTHT